jgi:hypothetical protein
MRLSIGRLHVRATLPGRLRARAPDAAHLARDILPRAIARRLDSRMQSCPAVCRIRRLRVRVRVTPRELDAGSVAELWADAFYQALLRAVHQPPETGQSAVADSGEEWLAKVICAVLHGCRLSQWPYDEFARYDGQAVADAVLRLARDVDANWSAIVAILHRHGALARLGNALGAAGCRELVDQLARGRSWAPLASVQDFLRVVAFAFPDRARYTSARDDPVDLIVLRAIAAATGQGDPPIRFSPRALRCAVLGFAFLVNAARGATASTSAAVAALLATENFGDAPAVPAILHAFVHDSGAARAEPSDAMSKLRSLVNAMLDTESRPPTGSTAESYESAVAGLFLLVRVVEHLQWCERVRRSSLGARYGSRALTYLLAGTALTLLGHEAACERLDPGVALFAGWIDTPDTMALTRLVRHDVALARELVADLAASDIDVGGIATWADAWRALGSRLLRGFASGLRGLARSSERFLVNRMLAVPGTILVDERRVLVRLRSNAFWPVVHLSAADASLEAVTWLGGRRVDFDLGGL